VNMAAFQLVTSTSPSAACRDVALLVSAGMETYELFVTLSLLFGAQPALSSLHSRAQLVKKFHACYGTRSSRTVFTRACPEPLESSQYPHTRTIYFVSSCLLLGFLNDLFLTNLLTKIVYAFLPSPYTLHVSPIHGNIQGCFPRGEQPENLLTNVLFCRLRSIDFARKFHFDFILCISLKKTLRTHAYLAS
jgi:hypothetical protein